MNEVWTKISQIIWAGTSSGCF